MPGILRPAHNAKCGCRTRDFVAGFGINKAGFAIAALFIVVWASAVAVWRFGKLESRWHPGGPPALPE
jgi:hypothetical protein